jgi:3-dehydroquinate dehydratase/shikimate dehydrogenase
MLFLSMTSLTYPPNCGSIDAFELRLDLFDQIDLQAVRNFIGKSACPVMLTLRKRSQGGQFRGSEEQREALIEQLLALAPQFFDLEWDMRPEFLRKVFNNYPQIKFVLSHHDFHGMPDEKVYRAMTQYPAFSYKIAATPASTSEALRFLLFAKTHPKLSVICMGALGAFTRVLAPIVGNLVNYASGDVEKTGPGQLSVTELMDIYHYPQLNPKTSIYGLIGDPIEKSVGHIYHNAVFARRNVKAVYVKMTVKPDELSEFISLAKELGMRGLSVTIPLKEKILPFVDMLDDCAKKIGAVNTLLFQDGKILGTNTDGIGALDAIEKRVVVQGKKMVLLGAGGAARAIAYEAIVRGAHVLILNRTVQRAKETALALHCRGGGLDALPDDYDILVNCSPDPMPIDAARIRPKTIVMDVVYSPHLTPFLQAAADRGCQIVQGEEMFLNQAVGQTAFWIGL